MREIKIKLYKYEELGVAAQTVALGTTSLRLEKEFKEHEFQTLISHWIKDAGGKGIFIDNPYELGIDGCDVHPYDVETRYIYRADINYALLYKSIYGKTMSYKKSKPFQTLDAFIWVKNGIMSIVSKNPKLPAMQKFEKDIKVMYEGSCKVLSDIYEMYYTIGDEKFALAAVKDEEFYENGKRHEGID